MPMVEHTPVSVNIKLILCGSDWTFFVEDTVLDLNDDLR